MVTSKVYFFVFTNSKVTFCFFFHWSFSLLSACYPKEIHLKRSPKFNFGGHHFETVLRSQAVFIWRHSIQKKLARKRNSATNFASFTRSAKCIFSKWLSTSIFSLLSFFGVLQHVWLKSSHNPGGNSQTSWEPFGQILLDGMTSRKHGLAAEHCSKWWLMLNFGLLWRQIL